MSAYSAWNRLPLRRCARFRGSTGGKYPRGVHLNFGSRISPVTMAATFTCHEPGARSPMRKSAANPALIRVFVDQGLSDSEIASKMGWTVGTLRVRCSQLKISLRRVTRTKNHRSLTATIVLPRTILDQLHQPAASLGVTTSDLAANLLREIIRDSLYEAVLDRGVISFKLASPPGSLPRPATARSI